ncbi:MAG: hypothetical protein GWP61_21070 [Chloroflexi bacterium]|nr:hypothetical protein [Chloroflexota bacterium]
MIFAKAPVGHLDKTGARSAPPGAAGDMGASTHPGTCVPTGLVSARLAATRLLKDTAVLQRP